MTLQQLHYFIATAEARSFTRAADICLVSQPALSHAIRELEEELQCRLFLREGRHIRLTRAGTACLALAREMERAAQEMRRVAREAEGDGEIRIGYVVLGHLNAFLSFQAGRVPGDFLKRHPIVTTYDEITEIGAHLAEGRLDCILIPATNRRGLPPHEALRVTEDALSLIVSRKSPLFTRESAAVAELKDLSFIFYPNNPDLNDAYRALCERSGFSPRIVGTGKKMGDIVSEVIQKNAVAFCSDTFDYLESPDIHIVHLTGALSPFHLELIRLKGQGSQAAAEFFQYLKAANP